MVVTTRVGYSVPSAPYDRAQVIGVVGAPLVLLIALSVKYAVIQTLGCTNGSAAIIVHGIAVVSLVLCAGAALVAQRGHRIPADDFPHVEAEEGRTGSPNGTEHVNRTPRTDDTRESYIARADVMHVLGLFMSAMSALIIVAQWMPQFALSTCAF